MAHELPPDYNEYVNKEAAPAPAEPPWALQSSLTDPAMRTAFVAAGAKRGWVGGAAVRRYCEREGLMRTGREGPGVAKRVLAGAWELADARRDARGLSFDEFCVFMHLLCIASAGGSLPASLPKELVPPSLRGPDVPYPDAAAAPKSPDTPRPAPPPPPRAPETTSDEALARSLQASFDEERAAAAAAAEMPPAPPVGTTVERAREYERRSPNGASFSGAYLVPGADPLPFTAREAGEDLAAWTREDLEARLEQLRPGRRGAWRSEGDWAYRPPRGDAADGVAATPRPRRGSNRGDGVAAATRIHQRRRDAFCRDAARP